MTTRLPIRLALGALSLVLIAAPASAQAPTAADQPLVTLPAPLVAEPSPVIPGNARVTDAREASAQPVSMDGLRAGVRAPVVRDDEKVANTVIAQGPRFTHAQVLMIVGGAALLTGAIIGDDAGTIVMIGGAAVGLWGLYLFLQ